MRNLETAIAINPLARNWKSQLREHLVHNQCEQRRRREGKGKGRRRGESRKVK